MNYELCSPPDAHYLEKAPDLYALSQNSEL